MIIQYLQRGHFAIVNLKLHYGILFDHELVLKIEQLKILKQLLNLAETMNRCTVPSSDCSDQERYLKMALKIDPNDPRTLDRNKSDKIL